MNRHFNTPPALQTDKEVVMFAVQHHGWALEYASPGLKADKGVVMAAVLQDGEPLKHASHALQVDEEILRISRKKF
jgi:hypothetical protein